MRILLADDHGLFLEGMQNLLHAGGYQVVGAAHDGLEALRLARALHPDVILMDIRMPRCDGLSATRLIQAELPEIKIVMLTTFAEDADLFEAIKSGASGYLLKNLEPSQLFDYLAGLDRGEAPLSRELSARLLAEGIPDVIIFDMTEPCERHVLPLLFKDPHLLMIGLDAERNRAVLVSGHEAHSLTLNQITEIVQTGAAALQ